MYVTFIEHVILLQRKLFLKYIVHTNNSIGNNVFNLVIPKMLSYLIY